ncbi:hypothetical protein M3Y99_01695400 [Aphelenchoides fujianensis]|nr:hypothetical protein M3Y99_01695400 [Aphelenchoides fujianensis]
MPARIPTSNDPGRRSSQRTRRKWGLLAVALLLLLFVGFQLVADEEAVDLSHYYALGTNQTEVVGACKIPVLEPWDETVRPYVKNAPPLECRPVQLPFSHVADGRLWLNRTAIEAAGYSPSALSCDFRCFGRGEDDDHNRYEEWAPVKNGTELACEFVEVNCAKRMPPLSVYSQFHSQIVPLAAAKQSAVESPRYSVALFVLDSVSQSHWQRGLPRTLNALRSRYNATILTGFNKVADNSFPNAIAFLRNHSGKLPTEAGDANYDEWPLIWKDFAKQGYATFYAEDYPDFNLFNYLSKGFAKKPVDHHFRPFWMEVYKSFVYRRSKYLCYNDQPMHSVQLRYFQELVQKYDGKRLFFALNWLTELAHDWLSQVSSADEDFERFLLDGEEHLKDAFFFMFSDHGHRFDPIRQTLVGRLEERMPFFSVHVPRRLVAEVPELKQTLEWNSKQLASFFDLYVTMRDLLDLQERNAWNELRDGEQPTARFRSFSPRGLSLLRRLPADRQCAEAGIPDEYCICQSEKPIGVDDPTVQRVADRLVEHVNALLQPEAAKCAPLRLKRIHNAHFSLPNHGVVEGRNARSGLLSMNYGRGNPRGVYLNYGVMVEVEPSGALLEARGVHVLADDSVQIKGDVNRINRYGNQSICIREATLRKFCFCI